MPARSRSGPLWSWPSHLTTVYRGATNNLEGRINRHIHPQSHHFLYLIKRQIELMVGDETKMIGAGNFVTIPQGILHSMQGLAPAYPPGGAVRSAWGDVPGPGG